MILHSGEKCFSGRAPDLSGTRQPGSRRLNSRKGPAVSTATGLLCLILLSAALAPVGAFSQDASLIQPQQQFAAAMARDDYKSAIQYGQQALDLAEQRYGANSIEIVDALELLAEAQTRIGNYDEAIRDYTRVVQIKEGYFGANHPELVSTLDALVDVHLLKDDFSAAETILQRILGIEKSVYGETHEDVEITLTRLRNLYLAANRPDDVERVDSELNDLKFRTRDLLENDPESLDARRYSTTDGFATVRVYYGTNRARTGNDKAAQFYGVERGELDLGYLDVSIPAIHKYGELETSSKWSIFTYGLGEDALKEKYVLLLKVEPLDEENFYTQLSEHIRDSPSNDVFMFVHGYNSSFEDAARRTAQLAYDLDFDGTPMMYSWPSQGSTTAYTVDEAAVRVSGRKMARFLTAVVQKAGADRIHLIAHSMGNRALIEALEQIVAGQDKTNPQQLFGQVIFTAPDVDRDYFVEALGSIRPVAAGVTLYASENDVALKTSAVLHGAPRAGLAGETIVTVPGIDTIDMSAVEADSLGHSYYAANEGAIYDLFRLFWRGEPPEQRCGLREQSQDRPGLWLFNVNDCKGGEVLEAGLLVKRFGRSALERVKKRLDSLTGESDKESREEWQRILNQLERLLDREGT